MNQVLPVKLVPIPEKRPLTAAEREARKAFRQVEAVKALNDHDKQQKAFHANRERLKSERLAREQFGV